MAHIVSCMVDTANGDLRSYISKSQASTESLLSSVSSFEERRPFTWRMQQTPDTRKYQLFPREKQPSAIKQHHHYHHHHHQDSEQAPSQAPTTAAMADKSDKTEKPTGLRMRIKEHNLIRRRKVSVPELGPMTTVQEVPMDSPTIPGRPPLHERSISSPVNSWHHLQMAEVAAAGLGVHREDTDAIMSTSLGCQQTNNTAPSTEPRSPKSLTPLVIPSYNHNTFPRVTRQLSLSRLRSGGSPCETATRSAKVDESPRTRTPFTPQSAAYITTPKSAATASTLPTPISAVQESRGSPKPWEKQASVPANPAHQPSSVDPTTTPRVDFDMPRCATSMSQRTDPGAAPGCTTTGHRRNLSDTGSIMERGRPRKRADGTPVGGTLRRTGSKRSKSSERQAFQNLPQGWKPSDATKNIEASEVTYLHKQAFGQAMRFEVLKKEDVESLSKELRYLDERTEYLRRTYTSLRAGRRNLHSRICQYLRSPRVAKFSYDSMLKQEEALAELDSSIDDWVTKLECAENRRTRVRQKLLEHVAAAAAISIPSEASGVSESLQQAVAVKARTGSFDVSTPPRSPAKTESPPPVQCPSPSPQRVVARVPSSIAEVPTEVTAPGENDDASQRRTALQRMESIRIYADSDVYALLADVESEFTKLSNGSSPTSESAKTSTSAEPRLRRAQSHDVLTCDSLERADKATPLSPVAPTPPSKDTTNDAGEVFLTSAVFQPAAVQVA